MSLLGTWWFQEDADTTYSGTLTLSKNRISLQLFGLDEKYIFKESYQVDQLNGIILDDQTTNEDFKGKHLILENCTRSGGSSTNSGVTITVTNFSIETVYVTEFSPCVKDLSLKFDTLAFEFSHLIDFVRSPELGIKVHPNFEKGGVDISYQSMDFPNTSFENYSIEINDFYSAQGSAVRDYTINSGVRFRVTSQTAISLSEWRENVIIPLQNLISLGTDRLNVLLNISGNHKDNFEIHNIGKESEFSRLIPTTIFNREIVGSQDMQFPNVYPLFDLRQLGDSYSVKLNTWLNLYSEKKTKEIQDTIFKTIFTTSLNREDYYLNLSKALEIYHKNTYPGNMVSTEEHESRVDNIVDNIDSVNVTQNDQDWTRDRLIYANQTSLKQRILHLLKNDLSHLKLEELVHLAQKEEAIEAQELITEKQEIIAKRIVKTRNKFTHSGGDLKDSVKEEIDYLCVLMTYMLKNLLLNKLEVSNRDLERIYKKRLKKVATIFSSGA